MDKKDKQDNTETEELLTGIIIGYAFAGLNELGLGFLESVSETS